MNIRCLTNNPSIIVKNFTIVEAIECSTLDLFLRVEDEILQGSKLITHPLSGSIGPDQSPYKTVVISGEKGHIDMESLEIIKNAINYTENLVSNRKPFKWDRASLQDFAIIDFEFVKGFLCEI